MSKAPLLLLAILAACSQATEPSDLRSLATHATLSRSTLHDRDSVTVTLSVTNLSARPVTLRTAGACLLAFRVTTAAGRDRGRQPLVCAAIVEDIEIPAGESRMTDVHWDLTTTAGPLQPGNYFLRGGLQLAGRYALQVESAPASFRILSSYHNAAVPE